ncbi:MAG: thiamine phosphate synthase [candidate division Zixibacteria bacterium]|nr:thiamine phosphate synthase [candidate division Zixibacteria bacterium]NIR66171.1 thiamine phosphate synthase [candidate division Zixibacteria bacterium]NIS17251.1 thiamine phosphate synthase [candidate division Zixibacteria bacterium]NIS47794.1 thiamine phosphate synthase [candidate division Zixibacteria bacterium]NIT53608.1 thiamine phosphate synthase [candidate division Zixibacteria bacterium]
MKPDYSLYLVTDRGLSRGRTSMEIIEAAVKGGVTVVQLREKHANTREFLHEALKVRNFCREKNILFIINDRLDIAQSVDADGVHLGQDDLPIEYARRFLGPDKIIGTSAFNETEAMEAEKAGADYLGISPIFTTPTKPELETGIGIDGLRKIRKSAKIPMVGIGGLGSTNAYDVIMAGADGIAVVSAIVSAADPEKAAAEIKSEIERARKDML